MKTLVFNFRGQEYRVNEAGEIKANGLLHHSKEWKFVGGKRVWNGPIRVNLSAAFADPKPLNGCYGVDWDHGTRREWLGRYYGKVPRIEWARVEA